ncbi:MAG: hypothetical protein CSA31_03110 [Desulfobulbus propionicus]|nr:MAG: hypothetical protein CSA31_03110 [Desulfobulbus propionicus]
MLNTLTKSEIQAEDLLFATLDPTSRRLRFPQDLEVIVTDTVGFIRNLPAELLKAFESTLEELFEADLLLHVVDISNPQWKQQIEVVESLLHQLELENIPSLTIFNKIDKLEAEQAEHRIKAGGGIGISAIDPATLSPLLTTVEQKLQKTLQIL